jgi:hypothetical protein
MANSIFLGAFGFSASGSTFQWPAGTTLAEVSQSILTLGPGGSGLPLLQFGGTTSSFPALRRGSNTVEVVLADQSAFASISVNTLQMQAAGNAFWLNRTILSSPADAQMNVTNFASSAGFGVDVSTDATVKIRTRAQTGYATVDALGYKVSGVAGVASFGPSAVASITVVNGLITAIS